jgi:cytochrome oxidase Cu insertion factor (SCO1/SenC/PrrC family)
VGGIVLGIVGVVGYFVVVLHFGAWLPRVRNEAVPNWIVVAVGLVLSAAALARAPRGRRALASVLLAANVLVAGAFGAMLYVVSAVPAVPGPAIGTAAPTFALPDQSGEMVRFEDFRGSPLLLVFYRGHW